jgi:hypothetical protein
MVNLTNLFTQIIAPFNTDSSVKVPSPFAASKVELNSAGYQTLNNNNDKYVNKAQEQTMQGLLDRAKNGVATDKGEQASDLYQGLLALKDKI